MKPGAKGEDRVVGSVSIASAAFMVVSCSPLILDEHLPGHPGGNGRVSPGPAPGRGAASLAIGDGAHQQRPEVARYRGHPGAARA
jgi:hypothetical protein